MSKKSILLFAIVILSAVFMSARPAVTGKPHLHHQISVTIDPEAHYLEAIDTITVPLSCKTDSLEFSLLSNLEPRLLSSGASLVLVGEGVQGEDPGMDREENPDDASISLSRYLIVFRKSRDRDTDLIIELKGMIYFPVEESGREYARGFSQTPGLLSDQGVYLAGSTFWVPDFDSALLTFEMTVTMPEGWDVVSQGDRTFHKRIDGESGAHGMVTRWTSKEPMEEIFLIAARFHEYSLKAGDVEVMAFLRTPDEALAGKYLETTGQYLEMYCDLIGDYPFSKFALIENFWETGYGMPSFTLLGEKVIRFPFILHSSYPHELLHNWWGNSVYVDFEKGNWCEGLTTYMADHLIKEQRGQGLQYRRNTLESYTNYVNDSNDLPLRDFLSRHDAATASVGYGKSLMMFHMLRQMVGDETFVGGVRLFYEKNRFRAASFDDIQRAFEDVSGHGLGSFFSQWVDRTGAPELRIADVTVNGSDGDWKMDLTMEQVQEDDAYTLEIPVHISFADSLITRKVLMYGKLERLSLSFRDRPLHIDVDPGFDLFRRLHHNEIPPSFSRAYGADRVTIVLPSRAGELRMDAYSKLADEWAGDPSIDVEITRDDLLKEIPGDRVVWLFGRDNLLLDLVRKGLEDRDAEISGDKVRLGESETGYEGNSFMIALRHPDNPSSVLAWLTIGDPEAVAGLARKLPHYGKYGYLVFEGSEPTNIVKGQWDAIRSPMSFSLSDTGSGGTQAELPKRKPLAELAPLFSSERMMDDIRFLADEELKGRAVGTPGIQKAAEYIAARFSAAGLAPAGDNGTYFQVWEDYIDGDGTRGRLVNVIGVLPGVAGGIDSSSVVVCAHYDHLGLGWPDVRKGNEGKIHPGADDNASGIAVMIELATHLARTSSPKRSVVFAAFTGEESGLRGSNYYVDRMSRYPASKCIGAINLDTVGRLGNGKVMVLNSSSAREWRFMFIGSSYVTGVESEIIMKDLDASDQVSFIRAGVPAVQIFSGPHGDYHRPSDTIDKIDEDGLVKIASFTREAILYLAEREESMSYSGPATTASGSGSPAGNAGGRPGSQAGSPARRVSTGCMPDFAFRGKGVKVSAVSDGSAAAAAGIIAGDVIIRLGSFDIHDLKEYSKVLKSFKPGDEVDIVVMRGGNEIKNRILLQER
jgi:aminopeptidase N